MARVKVAQALERLVEVVSEDEIERILDTLNNEDEATANKDKFDALDLAVTRAASTISDGDPIHQWLGDALREYRAKLR